MSPTSGIYWVDLGFMILSDLWWDKVDYILEFTAPIYDMLRVANTDKPCLHLMYGMWDLSHTHTHHTINQIGVLQSPPLKSLTSSLGPSL